MSLHVGITVLFMFVKAVGLSHVLFFGLFCTFHKICTKHTLMIMILMFTPRWFSDSCFEFSLSFECSSLLGLQIIVALL